MCEYSVVIGGLEIGCELPFTLDVPHDGLDHLWCGALTPDISCVQLQGRKKRRKKGMLTNAVRHESN